jgi:hypothetical protein
VKKPVGAVSDRLAAPCTAFEGARKLVAGPLRAVVLAVRDAVRRGGTAPVLTFEDATGRVLDFDLRGTEEEILARLVAPREGAAARGRGRPLLGVVGREVTLLPRHWDWLAAQPGGASVALRRLVDQARKSGGVQQAARAAQERAYRFMVAMAGDFPGFEEAARALFAQEQGRLEEHMAGWPEDVRDYVVKLGCEAPAKEGVLF